jgi:hypothetical protein
MMRINQHGSLPIIRAKIPGQVLELGGIARKTGAARQDELSTSP